MRETLCGLVFADSSQNDAAARLRRMAGAANDSAQGPLRVDAFDGGGLAARTRATDKAMYDSGMLLAAVNGAPRWTSSEFASIAQRDGHAAAIADAYRQHGSDFLQRLQGAFSLILIDRQEGKCIAAIDRMGVCQLSYQHKPGTGLLIGSTASCVQADPDFASSLDVQSIYQYLYFHMVPSPGSIYSNQFKLGPGEFLVCEDDAVAVKRYWQAGGSRDDRPTRRQLKDELYATLRASVNRCIGDSTTGSFLSGGIDSSTVAGILAEFQPHPKTFTIGFKEKGYDETAFAQITSNFFETEQIEYCVTPSDVVDMLPEIAGAYDEPFGNSSVVPTYYCARLARDNGIASLLAGDGGDELFAGNVRYVTQQIFGIYDATPGWLKSGLIEPLAFGIPGASRFMPTRKLQSYIRQARVPMPDRLQTYNYFSRTPVEEILEPDFLTEVSVDGPLQALRTTWNASQAENMLDRMLELDWKFTLADNDLRKVTRMCSLAGVDVHFPLLDDELVDLSSRVPPEMKISWFRLRHFFKNSMKQFLPPQVLSKSKHGFGLPFGIWMQSFDPLRELAYDSLSDFSKRRIINKEYLDSLISAHQSVHAHYYGEFIWVIMMLELWLQKRKVDANPEVAA